MQTSRNVPSLLFLSIWKFAVDLTLKAWQIAQNLIHRVSV
jgi:hypothetical protein